MENSQDVQKHKDSPEWLDDGEGARSGARFNPSSSSQKSYGLDYGRSQSVTEGHGLLNGSQTDKLCHSKADNTVLPSKRADTTTRSLIRHIKSQPEGLQQCIAPQRVPDHCRSVEKLHKFLPDCEKISGPSQNLQVTQWMSPLMEKKNMMILTEEWRENSSPPPKKMPKTALVASSSNSNVKKKPKAQNKGKGKVPATKAYSHAYRMPKTQQYAMENVFQMARTIMEFQKKEKARLKYQK
ncbi:hypothetical protein O181_009476 [Austropuccinia psidii MF-1]|uniref:Uncharacterized protein n=1 Tax=Austropuccinia psidii MF-1 TaxID=1389203 RepID=A0A9Q3BRW6_9BASI|nr:hypothetical protein [Austropuccinia psidii MF-1]